MIVRAAWVLPMSAPPLRDGAVVTDGARLVAVGPAREFAAKGADLDLGEAVLLPGLINVHTHLELTCYAGALPPAPLWDWLSRLIALRRAPGQVEREQQGVRDGAWQCLRAGVTCVGDISRRALNWQILKSLPLRKVCFVELLSMADHPPRTPDELAAAVSEVAEDDLLTAGITPHAPYTVPPHHLRAALELAARGARPWCTHWAETREELAFLAGEPVSLPAWLLEHLQVRLGMAPPRKSALTLLEEVSGGLPAGIIAHMNYATQDDAARLAALGHTVAYCPRAHQFYGHTPHPFRMLQAAGVRVVLGTDSAASNTNLHLLAEAQHVWRQADAPAPDTLLRMITSDAAAALGLGAQVGTLEAGRCADLAAFPLSADGRADPARYLVEHAPQPCGVWVAGQRVV